MDSLDNDIVVRFAPYLCSRDLVNLSLTCRRFGSSNGDGLSLMEDTARQIMSNAEKEERDALPRMANQTYIELYSKLLKHREPRIFDQLIGEGLSYVNDDDKSHIKFAGNGIPNTTHTAISNYVMRAGKHYATFIKEGDYSFLYGMDTSFCYVGITRPLPNWDKKGLTSFYLQDNNNYEDFQRERTERWGDGNINYCALSVGSLLPLACEWDSWRADIANSRGLCELEDVSHRYKSGDKIGLLLDLDSGTLTVYKNEQRLGMMKDGLSGEYCWCGHTTIANAALRIEKESIP